MRTINLFQDFFRAAFLAALFYLWIGPLAQAQSQLTRPSIKCLAMTPYFPGSGLGFPPRISDDIAYLNADMLRVEFIRESDYSINYCAYDYVTDNAGSRGIQILGLLDYQTISWSTQAEWATEAFRNRFVQRIQEIVTHYHNRDNPIRHWEIWNEEDIALPEFNVRIEPEPYARILIDAYAAIKAIDPEATVVLGGISPKNFEYITNYLSDLYDTVPLQDYYSENGFYPFDVVACHPYPEIYTNPTPSFGTGLDDVLNDRIKAIMNAHGDRLKKVWLTEMGWSSSGSISEYRQGIYLRDSFQLIDTLVDPVYPDDPPYVEKYFWFQYTDFGSNDRWGLWTEALTRKKPSYDRYLALTPAGPPPVIPPVEPGENPPLSGSSDSVLPFQVSGSDLIQGMEAELISGGFHSQSQGSVQNLTNGEFESNGFTLVLADYASPSLRIRYTFQEPMDLTEVRIFSGHFGDVGNRAFQSNDVYINGIRVESELNTGNYEQLPPGGDAVSLVRWIPEENEDFVATQVITLDIEFWCVSSIQGGFLDRWDPCVTPLQDIDGYGSAFVAPIIKEVDVFGTPHVSVLPRWQIY